MVSITPPPGQTGVDPGFPAGHDCTEIGLALGAVEMWSMPSVELQSSRGWVSELDSRSCGCGSREESVEVESSSGII